MRESILTTVLLPVALGIVMLGLGLSLTVKDFTRVAVQPKAVLVALTCQVILLPLICFGLVELFALDPLYAVGMMLLAASPGGTVANLYSHLFGGDVALNVTLTAVNSVLSVITLPIVVNLSLTHFIGGGQDIGLPADKVIQVFAIVLVPVALGMLVRHFRQAFADRMDKPVRIFSAVVITVVIVGAVIQERDKLVDSFAALGLITLAFSVVSLALGYWIPLLLKVERRQAIASGMEMGIHNSTLAITIALTLLNNPPMSIPPAIYALVSFLVSAAFGALLARSRPVSPVTAESG
ncbi:bile acid:sodium symporter family protein [Rhizohabitans arisaemae]|uniref:bile acid:sodium symporter family protein n=1 Tax=Rhizohabitans arisaemae TaxID=2720610 RepID=UPI0024B0A65B|nr:bile acid:sodium symporter family protein [Rhizohabitans arisaemae]